MEGQDIGSCFFNDFDQIRIERSDCIGDLLIGDSDISGVDVGFVELFGVFEDRSIAVLLDIIEDIVDDIDDRAELHLAAHAQFFTDLF